MHAGYRRPGPIYRWQNWWGIVLIADEEAEEERRILLAEDEAIARAADPKAEPNDGTFTLPPSLAHLVTHDEALHAEAEGDGGSPR